LRRSLISKRAITRVQAILMVAAIVIAAGSAFAAAWFLAPVPSPTTVMTTTTMPQPTTITTMPPPTTIVTTRPAKVTHLTWWAPIPEEPRRQAYLKAMQQYSEKSPELLLEFHHVDDLPEKLKLAVPAGVGPDFIRWAHDKIGEFKLLDLIVPIEDYISPEFKKQIPDYIWAAVTLDGHIWGIPETACFITPPMSSGHSKT